MTQNRVNVSTLLKTGLLVGIAGGLAEVAVVCVHAALTGGDASLIARNVASAVGLNGASAMQGLAVHMSLAILLGVALAATLRAASGWIGRMHAVLFMLASLAAIWAINFFVVLPALSPGFVHLLPYAVTLTSKLAFGLAAAGMWTWRNTSRNSENLGALAYS